MFGQSQKQKINRKKNVCGYYGSINEIHLGFDGKPFSF